MIAAPGILCLQPQRTYAYALITWLEASVLYRDYLYSPNEFLSRDFGNMQIIRDSVLVVESLLTILWPGIQAAYRHRRGNSTAICWAAVDLLAVATRPDFYPFG